MISHNRINLEDHAEVMLLADNLSISIEHLKEIVAKVGPMIPSVSYYAKKTANDRK
jgi:hypothetical protein